MASKNFKKKSTPSKNKGYVSRIYSEYELMWELGRGSFGIVWAAKRRGTSPKDPPYALKRTFPVDDTQGFDDLRLMEKELEALSQLRQYQHPNVVEINTAVIEKPPEGWVEENDPLFKEFMKGVPEAELLDSCNGFGGAGTICPVTIVQRYCPGGTLEDWLRTTCLADRDADLLLNFATQLADGLRFLHYKNIIHRDLKPGNIFLKKLDEFPGHEDTTLIRLGDLGMSKFVQRTDREMDTRGTRLDNLNLRDDVTNASAGTPLYLSPEQEAGLSYGFSVDVYALGLILAELFLPCPAKPILLELKDYAAKKTSTFNPTLILFPVMELILKMMSTSPQERPSASTVHSVLLAIWRGMLTLPVHYYPTTLNTTSRLPSPSPARESDIWLERPELDDLLKSYQDSRERIFFLSGPAGSGKSTIGLQFAQKVTLTDGGTSIIWITLNEGWVVKNELEVVGRQLRANIYRDSGHRVAVSEFIYLINDAFRDQKWIFILDNFNSGNPLEHAVLLELIRIQQDITVTNKPFVLIVTRKQYLYQTILSERLHYITEREFGPIFTGSRLLQKSWRHINPSINFVEIQITGSSVFGMEYLSRRLNLPQSLFHGTLFKLGQLLGWNPLCLHLAGCTISSLPLKPELSCHPPPVVQNLETYITSFINLIQEFYGEFKKVPNFYRFEEYAPSYTDDYIPLIVLHLTMCQIEEALSSEQELLKMVRLIQLDILFLGNSLPIGESYMFQYSNPAMSKQEIDALECKAYKILESFGFLEKCEEKRKYFHVCGEFITGLTNHTSRDDYDEEMNFPVKQEGRGVRRYNLDV